MEGQKDFTIAGKKVEATAKVIAVSGQMENPIFFDCVGEVAEWASTTTDEVKKLIESGGPFKKGNIEWCFDWA